EHGRVIYAAPGQQLRLSGALGPLQSEAVTGTLSFVIAPSAYGARITMSYAVGGYLRGGAAPMATTVDQMLGEQLDGFKRVADALHH
ncbi:MAG: ATPase, partial [bacterium]|nr:ATPase [bacterium]